MQTLGVREEDARDKMRWKKMICLKGTTEMRKRQFSSLHMHFLSTN